MIGKYGFEVLLEKNLDIQLERVKIKLPVIIAVDGTSGQGKTTLVKRITDYVNMKNNLPPCTLDIKNHPQMSLGGKEFMKQFNYCKQHNLPILTYDEAGDYGRRNAMTIFNRMINRNIDTFRSSGIILIFCCTDFNILDNYLFRSKVTRLLIHCHSRTPKHNIGAFSAYSYRRMGMIKEKFSKLMEGDKHKCYSVSPNFRGSFRDLPEDEREALKKLSDFGKSDISKEAEIKLHGYLSYEEIATKIGRSIAATRMQVYQLGIKPQKLIDHRAYFDAGVVAAILNSR